jgi:TCP-1/cpn60 chaperonin family/Resolvase, N terminal domain
MRTSSVKSVRCAIYTRVSTEQGLDQDFNSLDAQYEAASAYIKSQAHAGWTLIRSRYDDGGYSGGSTDRPDLQRLLDDIRSRKLFVGLDGGADAMHATRAAVEEGIVPGGGVALLRASEQLKRIKTANDDQKTGVEIVRKALSYPARQIAINAGEDGSIIVGKILEKDQYAYGFDSQTGEYVNLISKGIIDPTKVVRVAIQNAASVAALLITTEAMVAEVPKKNAGGGGMPPGGGMGGMGGMDF